MILALRRRGTSLLEIVSVAGLLAFALIPILNMSRGGIARTEHAMKRVLAVNLANRMVDRFAAMPYPQLAELLDDGDFDPERDPLLSPGSLPESLRDSLAEYTKTVKFREAVPNALGVVEVEVAWIPKRGSPETRLKAIRVVMNPR